MYVARGFFVDVTFCSIIFGAWALIVKGKKAAEASEEEQSENGGKENPDADKQDVEQN